ncbi:MAG TPA: trypsin-like peptidase domain-containing protein [Vicinamibacterales bacterium]|jgi:serine protease Do|nr:trypsin-like peptidase domain-containing protein [Acidobacteriota bacterium]HQX82464.1 trypsin-like peptidase domain-containing protein [Vicinamibacterales bacterium]
MKALAVSLVALAATVGFLLGLVAAGGTPTGSRRGVVTPAALETRPLSISTGAAVASPVNAGTGVDFAAVAARVNGAVVNVDAVAREIRGRTPRRFQRDMTDENGAPREGSGSGFIIDAAGFILTNHHVVEGADLVTVTLGDGRALRATVVGTDPAIDVALLKVDVSGGLPVALLGDSDTLRVGEWVCAIGNPMGYVHSVTVGVVSFLGRKLFDQSLDAYIQTDAAISFGNSGGPLINSRGQVVGMTTAVSSQASNIGFAIPISQIVSVLPQLREHGRVARGYAGVVLTTATPRLQAALQLARDRGALVQDVPPETPASRAGLRPYDLITAIDDVDVVSDDALIRYISAQAPGTVVRFDVWRDRSRQTVTLKLTERPLPSTARAAQPPGGVRPALSQEQGPLGMIVRDIDDVTARRNALPESVTGVMISDVDLTGPARQARLRRGQVVMEINRQRIGSAAQFQRVVAALPRGAAVAVYVFDPVTDQRAIYSVIIDPS